MSTIRRLSVILVVMVVANLSSITAWGSPVRGFTDSKGVMHITNDGKPGPQGDAKSREEPGSEKAVKPTINRETPGETPPERVETPALSPGQNIPPPEPQRQADEQPASSGEKHPESSLSTNGIQSIDPDSPEADPFLSPVRYVAWRKPGPAPGLRVSRRAPEAKSSGYILSYRDGRGVLHIENTGVAETPEPRPHDPEEVAAVRSMPPNTVPLAPPAHGGLPSLQQVAWPSQPRLPRQPQTMYEPEPKPAARLEPEVIKCYRDTRGVLHVTNEDAPDLANRPPPGWPGGRRVTLATYTSGIREGPGTPEASRALPHAAKVVAGRDRQGRLIIRSINPETMRAGGLLPQARAEFDPIILEASQSLGLPVPLILALIKVESNFASQAVSPKGAMGLMQLMPGTATGLGVRDPFDPRENILAGCRHLRFLLDRFQGSLPLAVAAYNAGHQRVVAAGYAIPAIKETREFVKNVMELYYLMEQGRQGL